MMMSRFIVLITLALTTVNATDVLRPVSPTRTLDFHGRALDVHNIDDVMLPVLREEARTTESIELNLSDNFISPDGAEELISLLRALSLLDKVTEVNLTNNRLKAKGFKALMPLIAQPSCRRVLVPLNDIRITDMQDDLWRDLKDLAASVGRETRQNAEELLKQWERKIIWLDQKAATSPVSDRFNVSPELDKTQREYYGVTAH
jgi:hypothetical protein